MPGQSFCQVRPSWSGPLYFCKKKGAYPLRKVREVQLLQITDFLEKTGVRPGEIHLTPCTIQHHSPGGSELCRSHLTNPVTPLLATGDTRPLYMNRGQGLSLTPNGPKVKGLASLGTRLACVETSAIALAGRAFHSRPQKSEGEEIPEYLNASGLEP